MLVATLNISVRTLVVVDVVSVVLNVLIHHNIIDLSIPYVMIIILVELFDFSQSNRINSMMMMNS